MVEYTWPDRKDVSVLGGHHRKVDGPAKVLDLVVAAKVLAVASAVDVPVVGIGGVTVQRSTEIATTTAAGVAVIGAVMGAEDVGAAVRGLMEPWTTPPPP
jgi:thiamine monophosphate synthase